MARGHGVGLHVSRGVALLGMLGTLVSCGKHAPVTDDTPAPSASVVTIGASIGTCDDVAVCAKECDAGSADRCRRLAGTYAFGQGADRDEARATDLYAQACAMNDPASCVFAGQMHEYAHGVPKDDVAAARLYERACDMKWPAGCYNLGIMFENGRGVPRDRAKAGDLYQVACTAGSTTACGKAKDMHEPAPIPFLDAGLL
jgi:TPR repeat protein